MGLNEAERIHGMPAEIFTKINLLEQKQE